MAYTNNLHVVYGEASLGVNGQDFAYLFSYELTCSLNVWVFTFKLMITNSTNCLSLQSIINLAIRNLPMK